MVLTSQDHSLADSPEERLYPISIGTLFFVGPLGSRKLRTLKAFFVPPHSTQRNEEAICSIGYTGDQKLVIAGICGG